MYIILVRTGYYSDIVE